MCNFTECKIYCHEADKKKRPGWSPPLTTLLSNEGTSFFPLSSLLVAFIPLTTISNLLILPIIYLLYDIINSLRARTLSFSLLDPQLFMVPGALKFGNLWNTQTDPPTSSEHMKRQIKYKPTQTDIIKNTQNQSVRGPFALLGMILSASSLCSMFTYVFKQTW